MARTASMTWRGAPLNLDALDWLQLQLLLPPELLAAGIALVQDDCVEWVDAGLNRVRMMVDDDRTEGRYLVDLDARRGRCECAAWGPCAHVAAALVAHVESGQLDPQTGQPPDPAEAYASLLSLPDAVGEALAETPGGLEATVEIVEQDGRLAHLQIQLRGGEGTVGQLQLPASLLPRLLGAPRVRYGERLERARRPDQPLEPQVDARLGEDGALHVRRWYRLGDAQTLTAEDIASARIDDHWAWLEGGLHPIAAVPSPLLRLWDGPDQRPESTVFEFVRSELPALRRCEAFHPDPVLDQARVVRQLNVASVEISRKGESPWFYLEPRYSAGELEIALDELRVWSREGLTRVRLGHVWIEVPSAAELERVARHYRGDGRVSASGLLQLSSDWDGRVEIRADDTTRAVYEQLRQQRPLPPAEAPAGLTSTLRSYQQEGFAWLQLLARLQLGGILADEMGLGKTHQAMALLAWQHLEREPEGPPSLVVCPRSVLDHWAAKLSAHVPGLGQHRLHGPDRWPAPEGARVWLTTYDVVVRDQAKLAQREWSLLLLDEAQRAKNVRTKIARGLRKIDASARLALTGTPIENALTELWALFDLLLPDYLGSQRAFARRFARPIEKDDDQAARIHLQRLVRPLILRRRKAEVLTDLPEKIEDLRLCSLSPQQELLYRQILQARMPSILANLEDERRQIEYLHILAMLTKLKQVCDHPALVLDEAERGEDPLALESGKFSVLIDLLDETLEGGHKVVVFSQYLTMLDLICAHLDRRQVPFSGLRGNTVDRAGAIARFQDDDACRVFCASLMAGGVGIDLTAASVVIHYDRWWNAAREDQATDRIHRIGQERGVQVIKLLTQGTIEERIDELIERKASLSGGILDSEAGALRQFTREELIELLQHPELS